MAAVGVDAVCAVAVNTTHRISVTNRERLLILIDCVVQVVRLDRIYEMFQDEHVNLVQSFKSCLKTATD